MSTTADRPTRPAVLGALEAVEAELAGLVEAPVHFLSAGEKRELLVATTRVTAQVDALRLRVMAASGDLAEAEGARDVASVLASRTGLDLSDLRRDQRLAEALDHRWSRLAAAMAAGGVTRAQAVVIAAALDALRALPADVVEDHLISRAEAHLVGLAAHHGPRELRVLGRRVLDVLAPEVAEATEARLLATEESHARQTTTLSMTRLGDGTTRLAGRVPDLVATRLATYLDAFTSPRRSHGPGAGAEGAGTNPSTGPDDRRPYGQRLGNAFCALLETLDPDRLPLHGGSATTVVVTMTLDALRSDLAAAGVVGAERLTAAEARRLACTADLLPAVLDGRSEPLDLGRAARLYTRHQRKAMAIRDQRCRAEGCTIPATWCEAHHLTPWSRGGQTDLTQGVLLCSHHHHRAHDPTYDHRRMTNGDYRFHRRP